MNYIAQIFGLIGLIFTILSYQNTKKDKFLIGQILSNATFTIQYLLLGAYSAVVSIIIALLRNFTFLKFSKKNERVPFIIFLLFEMIVVIFGIITFDGIISLFPIIITLLFSYATWQNNLKVTYFISFIVMVLYIIFNFYVGAYVSIISNVLELISTIVGLIKLKNKKD